MGTLVGSSHIRVSARAKELLGVLAKRDGTSMQKVLDEAVEQYHRDRFLDEVNAAYLRLKSDPVAWKEELAERADWDSTLMDGLEEE